MNGRVLAAPDKFKGTATAIDLVRAIAKVAKAQDWAFDGAPMADGGEGTLEVLGGSLRVTTVPNPLGDPVEACWALKGDVAVIEMARASGLLLVGGADGNDPLRASTAGTGELIVAAAKAGAKEIVVGVGGSATTDGGLGCIEVLRNNMRHMRGVDITAITDVDVKFLDAAKVFGPQKGATPAQITLLERRLSALAEDYRREFDVDVTQMSGAGAAGGLAGALVAFGGHLAGGFDYLSEAVDLERRVSEAKLVITGEGRLDDQSWNGKVVGGVLDMAERAGVDAVVIAGSIQKGLDLEGVNAVSLTNVFGQERALEDTIECVELVVKELLVE